MRPLMREDSLYIKYQEENKNLKAEINSQNELIDELYSRMQELNNKIRDMEMCAEQNLRQHNERGAGRKSKITPEIADYVVRLRQEGYSFAEISNICAQNDIVISKSTVDRIIKAWNIEQN